MNHLGLDYSSVRDKWLERFYDRGKGWVDGTTIFADLVLGKLKSNDVVLDLGAGAGKDGPMNFKGCVREVVGVDIDAEALARNDRVDKTIVGSVENIPLENESVDAVYSDWVAEHIERPKAMAGEVMRVLRPGGYFMLRTGNLWHYSYALAFSTPHWFHALIANRVRGMAGDAREPHRAFYRFNTRRVIGKIMARAGFIEGQLQMIEPEPSYLMFTVPSFLVGVAYERLVNTCSLFSGFRACILGSFRKPSEKMKI